MPGEATLRCSAWGRALRAILTYHLESECSQRDPEQSTYPLRRNSCCLLPPDLSRMSCLVSGSPSLTEGVNVKEPTWRGPARVLRKPRAPL